MRTGERTAILIASALALAFSFGASARAADPIPITVTDEVLVPEVKRLGINLCSNNYWDCAMLKVRAAENFEGLRYRMMTWGPLQDANGLYVWFSPTDDPTVWDAMRGKVRYTILGGPAKGTTGFIKDIRKEVCPADHQKRTLTYIEFDKDVAPWTEGNQMGIMLELDRPDQGSIRESSNPDHWNTRGNDAHIGDVPPGSFGQAALWLKGTEKPAHYAFGLSFEPMLGEGGSTWLVTLWAKAKSGAPTLTLRIGDSNTDVPVGPEWARHELKVTLAPKQADTNIGARVIAAGGDVLVDDIEIRLDEPCRNPTAFRDIVVDPLKKLNPGILRYLQMGGSDLEDNLRPALKQMGSTRDFKNLVLGGRNNPQNYEFTLHDFYVLCEYIGADPWYCLPGTIHPEEINKLMEYLGAPADVGYGKLRAELGHPKPWTEVFANIYVEIGNEAWNPSGYATGSYNGPDHWKDIFAAAKASPHYDKKTLFVAGAQAGAPHIARNVLANAPNSDRVAVAPYMIHHLKTEEVAPLDTDDKLFRWVFGFADRRVKHEQGEMRKNFEYASAANTEVAIYEHNYHITSPSVNEGGAPAELRNKIIASLGGGINLVNDSLHMVRELKVRSQALFNLNQKQFREGVKLWGFMPGLSLKDPRYRPSFLATEIANHVMAGDMVRTVHPEGEPVFTAHGIMDWPWGKKPEFSDYGPLPVIRSYAFKDGARRGLILFNFDTREARAVKLALPGAAKGGTARAWRLAADSITANNEYETGDPQVRIAEETIRDFGNGRQLDLPAHSMLVVAWEAMP